MEHRLFVLLCLASLLAACATATPFVISGGPQQNALIEGDSGAFNSMPVPGNYAFLETINRKKISGGDSKALVPPGAYTVGVDCQIHAGSLFLQGHRDITFTAQAGHIYKFSVDPVHEEFEGCTAFVYDATGGKDPYPESVRVIPPYEPSNWEGSGKAYGGHFIQDWLPKGQSEDKWTQMLEIEYWSKLMFPQAADELFHSRIASAMKQCPGTQLTVLSESNNDVSFELENPGCAVNKVHTQLSRFMTGQYGVYEVSYLSVNPVSDADKSAWLQSLHDANTVIKH